MVSLIGGFLTFTLGSALILWGANIRGAMEHDAGRVRVVARLPRGATQDVS
ncbi:hypothetical protein [Dankookia rubra]|uniref:hypothetical protein n=1 Tax=Dankookia rubra TaxID=1442381 RepID=UPI00140C4F0D|nr:hypothetical protein [Dankookia rubra]